MPSSVSINPNILPAFAQNFFPAPGTPDLFPDAYMENRSLTSGGSSVHKPLCKCSTVSSSGQPDTNPSGWTGRTWSLSSAFPPRRGCSGKTSDSDLVQHDGLVFPASDTQNVFFQKPGTARRFGQERFGFRSASPSSSEM